MLAAPSAYMEDMNVAFSDSVATYVAKEFTEYVQLAQSFLFYSIRVVMDWNCRGLECWPPVSLLTMWNTRSTVSHRFLWDHGIALVEKAHSCRSVARLTTQDTTAKRLTTFKALNCQISSVSWPWIFAETSTRGNTPRASENWGGPAETWRTEQNSERFFMP